MGRLKHLAFGVITIIAVLGCCLGIVEVYFRFFNPQLPSFLQPDPVIGTKHIPNLTISEHNSCIQATFHFNKEGMNDVDHDISKPADTYRIAVIGDSYVEATQVELEDTFFRQLQSRLTAQGKKVEVLAFGVGGFGTAQEYLLLRDYALKYKPDLVVLSFLTINDIRNNSFALEQNLDMPYATLTDSGQVAFQDFQISRAYLNQYNSPLRTLIFDHFHGLRYAYRMISRIPALRNVLADLNIHTKAVKQEPSIRDNSYIYFSAWPDEWEKAWQLTQALILKIKDDSKANGANFLLFSLSNTDQLNSRLFEENSKKYPGVQLDQDAPEKRLQPFAEEHELSYLSALPTMRTLTAEGKVVHPACHGHWSKDANHAAGELLAQYIQDHFLMVP